VTDDGKCQIDGTAGQSHLGFKLWEMIYYVSYFNTIFYCVTISFRENKIQIKDTTTTSANEVGCIFIGDT
jgi:hypothetical protein